VKLEGILQKKLCGLQTYKSCTVQPKHNIALTRTSWFSRDWVIVKYPFCLRALLKHLEGWILTSETSATFFLLAIIQSQANQLVRKSTMLHLGCTVAWSYVSMKITLLLFWSIYSQHKAQILCKIWLKFLEHYSRNTLKSSQSYSICVNYSYTTTKVTYSTTHEQRRVWSRVGCETRTCVMRAKHVQLPHSLVSIAVHVCYTRTFARGED